MFQGSNHNQHDIMDHDHNHETPTGFIKIDNQIIFTQEFAKKIIQIYENMVNVLKQLENIKRVNKIIVMCWTHIVLVVRWGRWLVSQLSSA